MTGLLHTAALACTLLGLVAAGVVLLALRDARASVGVLVELLLAAGLLRLSADPTWTALLVTAALVGLRRLLAAGPGRPARAH